jgi:hypothetical protein
MAFIRIKNISGNQYAYLVENIQTNKGSRQKVKKYLGKVHKLEEQYFKENPIDFNTKKSFITSLALRHIPFKKKENKYHYKNLVFCPKKLEIFQLTKKKTKKEAIIKTNEGYLSTHTLQNILEFKKTTNIQKDAYILAKHFIQAGLNISKEEFIDYYKK